MSDDVKAEVTPLADGQWDVTLMENLCGKWFAVRDLTFFGERTRRWTAKTRKKAEKLARKEIARYRHEQKMESREAFTVSDDGNGKDGS